VKPALIYSQRFGDYCYGDDHPFKVLRYQLTHALFDELGLLGNERVDVLECPVATEEDLLLFHRQDYLERLADFSASDTPRADFFYGLGDVENPVFKGLYDWARLVCGGTLEAADQVTEGGRRIAFNMAGGWHHAHAARASGFSYLNDAVIAIESLVRQGLRVAYVDIDAHHGDGVQEAFYTSDKVLTISLHETGDDFFPHTGYVREFGRGVGYGYAVNVPFIRHADDRLFRIGFERIALPLLKAYAPDVLVSQMGVDALRTDPLTRLEMTTASIEFAALELKRLDLPWVVLGGGGYDKINVARAWALLWGILSEQAVPDLFPSQFVAQATSLGLPTRRLRDLPHRASDDDHLRALKALEGNIRLLEEVLFPLHGVTTGAVL